MTGLLVLATSIWMAVDASRLGYDRRDIQGLAAMSPVGWLFAGLLLWIVAFPLYLAKRGELKAAGERRRMWALTGHAGPLPLPGRASWHPGPSYRVDPFAPLGSPFGVAPHVSPPAPYAPRPAPPSPEGPLGVEAVKQQLAKLDDLRVSGLLTDDEYHHQRMRVLDRM